MKSFALRVLCAGSIAPVAIVCLAWAGPVAGREAGAPADLGRLVVTGAPFESPAASVPFHMTVVDRAEIEKSGARTLSDALSGLPGVFVHRTGEFGRTDPEIRGLGERGRKTVILVDGIPVKMSLFGCSVSQALTISNIERIEVARGPNSVLYGSDALGGVINIITRAPAEEGRLTDFTLSGGSDGTMQGVLSHGGRSGDFSYFLATDLIRSDGHRPQSDYRSADHSLRLGYALSPAARLTFFGNYSRSRKYEPGALGKPVPPAVPDDYERTFAYLALDAEGPEHLFSAAVSHNYGHHRLLDGWRSGDNTYRADLSFTTFAIEENELTVGFNWQWQDGRRLSAPGGNWHRFDYGAWFWNRKSIGRQDILIGGRLQRDSVSGGTFSPQAGLVSHFPGGRFRVQASRAYRFPALNELYLFPPSNPDLKPETVTGYEAGVESELFGPLSAGLNFFYLRGRDRIDRAPNPVPPPPLRFQNVERFSWRGVESTISAKWDRTLVSVAHTWLDPGDDTRGRPGSKFDLSLRHGHGPLSVSAGLQHVGRYYERDRKDGRIASHTVVNTRLGWEFQRGLQAFLGVDNLLDADYLIFADLPGGEDGLYPMAGRTFRFGLRGAF